ncbi:MAG TPA: hypothetical protein VEP90_20715 [Methylomirabilota bacterium]|nr:hypothetical protein [Methylomirabilota bacterium]
MVDYPKEASEPIDAHIKAPRNFPRMRKEEALIKKAQSYPKFLSRPYKGEEGVVNTKPEKQFMEGYNPNTGLTESTRNY